MEGYWRNYSYDYAVPSEYWAHKCRTKVGMKPNQANASISYGFITRMWKKVVNSLVDAVVVELGVDPVLHQEYGAPKTIHLMYEPSSDGLNVTLRWLNKTTTRLPESMWMEWRPPLQPEQRRTVTATKIGVAVNLADVVANGTWMHA